MPEIAMPRLSDSMEEGTVLAWLKGDGDEVAEGEPLVEIETDKATMTYDAPAAGRLRIGVAEGATAAVGALIARVLAPGEPEEAPAAAPGAAAPTPAAPAAEDAAPPAPVARPDGARIVASPLARRLAHAHGVDLGALAGSGMRGRIVKADVLAAIDAPPAIAPPAVVAEGGAKGVVTVVEPTRTQQLIARRMAEAKATVPEFTVSCRVEMDACLALRAQLKALAADGDGVVPTVNDFVVRAAALALRRAPRANGAYRDGRFELFSRVNVGIAVAAPDALLVPTVFDADRRSLSEIAAESRRLVAAARGGTLTPAELAGGTFTVSNLGMLGVSSFQAVINAPQAAILAVAGTEEVARVRDGALAVARVMTLTLTADHRILYGADAAAFLADVRSAIEQPLSLLV